MVSVLNDIYQALYFISNLIRSEFAKIQHNCLTKTEAIYNIHMTITYINIYRFALHIKQIINEAIQSCQFKKRSYYSIHYSNLALYTLNKIIHCKIKGELVIF